MSRNIGLVAGLIMAAGLSSMEPFGPVDHPYRARTDPFREPIPDHEARIRRAEEKRARKAAKRANGGSSSNGQ